MAEPELAQTPLHELHLAAGARMVPFAGYAMPLQYKAGIMAEHLHCRGAAALFDVSHMGQVVLRGADVAAALERLVPGSIKELAPGRARYTLLTNEVGGIRDDVIVTNGGDHLFMVVNASTKAADLAYLQSRIGQLCAIELVADRALLALQGPAAVAVLARLWPDAASLRFMESREAAIEGIDLRLSRLGYTGEDGFELSVPADRAPDLARRLLAEAEVEWAGLGARDSLRMEAGLCLYGNDIDPTTTPIEAELAWTIGKRRRQEGGFCGDDVILRQLQDGPERKLVGIRPVGRAPARAGAEIQGVTGAPIGRVTSGGFGPSIGGPIALGYVEADIAQPGTEIQLSVREKALPAEIVALPFTPHRYHR